jgi:hypothetical protein
MHLTRGGRDAEALRHPYLAALRQLLLELLPRPANAMQGGAAATPSKGEPPLAHALVQRSPLG